MEIPILSVVLLVYNGEKYLREAIDSVLNQTFRDFELIIVNDGSTDDSLKIINSFDDKRIRIINNTRNKGIPICRNLGIKEAKGEYLAWTDCDDINLPTRFEKQINFLHKNKDYGGCGTWLYRFKGIKINYVAKALEDHNEIKAALLFRPAAVPNATVMLRLSEVRKNHITYNPGYPVGEDYDFVFRCSQHFKFSNIQEVLYKYRDSETSIMTKFEEEETRIYNINKKIFKQGLIALGIQPTDTNLITHYNICSKKIYDSFSDYLESYRWLLKIKENNRAEKTYDPEALNQILADQFFFASKKASKFGLKTLEFFVFKSLRNNWGLQPIKIAKLGMRCAMKYDKFEFRKS